MAMRRPCANATPICDDHAPKGNATTICDDHAPKAAKPDLGMETTLNGHIYHIFHIEILLYTYMYSYFIQNKYKCVEKDIIWMLNHGGIPGVNVAKIRKSGRGPSCARMLVYAARLVTDKQ